MKIWIYSDRRQQGPFTPDQLAGMNLRPETPVWYEGLDSWKPAAQCPELQHLFVRQPYEPHDAVGDVKRSEDASHTKKTDLPEPPPTHLGLTIFLTVCCCSPLSVAGLVSSICSLSFFSSGKYEKARKASVVTEWLIMISIALGFIPVLLMLNWFF